MPINADQTTVHVLRLNSLRTMFILCVPICILLFTLFHLNQNSLAPEVSAYNWKDHPKTIIITYFKDCGCGHSPDEWIVEAGKRKYDVLVLTKTQDARLETKFKINPKNEVVFQSGVADKTLNRICIGSRMTVLRIDNGRIVRWAYGGAKTSQVFD